MDSFKGCQVFNYTKRQINEVLELKTPIYRYTDVWCLCVTDPNTFLYLQHIELNEPASKDSEGPNDAHCHENTQQDVVQHHGNKLPLLRCLQWNRLDMHLTWNDCCSVTQKEEEFNKSLDYFQTFFGSLPVKIIP